MGAAELTERELKVMRAMARGPNCSASLEAIAARLGYKPPKSGVLSVRSTLHPMLRKHGHYQDAHQYGASGKYVGFNPAENQWDTQKWFLTDAGRKAVNA